MPSYRRCLTVAFTVYLMLGGAQGSAMGMQLPQACTPVDSALVRSWHAEWDTANIAQRALGGAADSGVLHIPPTSSTHVPVALATGTFVLTEAQLMPGTADRLTRYRLEVWRASPVEARRLARSGGVFARGTVIRGRLRALDAAAPATVAITGVLGQDGGMAFGRADSFLIEDGESYDVIEATPRGLRGWYTGGSVVPTTLAYFCAVRIQ
jgi:hypothetical protein